MRLIMLFLLVSQTLLATSDHGKVVQAYKSNYKDIAISEMYRTGIPASIKLAQGMLESNWGRSELANTANNHFGIKCGAAWTGGEYYREDDDYNKQGELMKSCFRKFESAMESYTAHSEFLMDPKKEYRYGFLFDLETTDYKAWAQGLKDAGYATDPAYPAKLISIIEKYNLNRYDVPINSRHTTVANATSSTTAPATTVEAVSAVSTSAADASTIQQAARDERMPARHISTLQYDISSNNEVRMVLAMGGETIEQLSRKVGISADDLLTHNELYLQKEDILQSGAKIYLEKKSRKLKAGPDYHIVEEGETMEDIAQLYGVRLKSLMAKNRMPRGSVTVAGARLFLKDTAGLDERPQFQLPNSKRKHKFLFEDDPTVE